MIYTITLNPSLDYVMTVPSFASGKTNRSQNEIFYPGGKGFNVSRMLNHLEVANQAWGFIAGFTGEEIQRRLIHLGVNSHLIKLPLGDSRVNVKIKGTEETEINGQGPLISQDAWIRLKTRLAQLQDGDVLVLAGSVPASLPVTAYAELLKQVIDKKLLLIVDACGEMLLATLPFKPLLIKPNLAELEELYGQKITSFSVLEQAVSFLVAKGAQNVLVSLGKDGALLFCSNYQQYYCPAAQGALKNSVGSGDSMVAGWLAGYLKTQDMAWALRLGSACGGATAQSEDIGRASLVWHLFDKLQVISL